MKKTKAKICKIIELLHEIEHHPENSGSSGLRIDCAVDRAIQLLEIKLFTLSKRLHRASGEENVIHLKR